MSESLKAHSFQILLALAEEPLHGTAIAKAIVAQSRGAVRVWPGTLYSALSDLEASGMIAEVPPPEGAPSDRGKRRFYQLTPSGDGALRQEVRRLHDLLEVARDRRLLKEPGHP